MTVAEYGAKMKLYYKNEELANTEGETFLSLAKKYQSGYDAPIILAKVNQKLIELNKNVGAACTFPTSDGRYELTFITAKDPDGYKTYEILTIL